MSCRVLFLAFLIHQLFSDKEDPTVALCGWNVANSSSHGPRPCLDGRMPTMIAPYARTLPCSVCPPLCWRRTKLTLLARCIPDTHALQRVAVRTMELALELGALVDMGLPWRFPDVFP